MYYRTYLPDLDTTNYLGLILQIRGYFVPEKSFARPASITWVQIQIPMRARLPVPVSQELRFFRLNCRLCRDFPINGKSFPPALR